MSSECVVSSWSRDRAPLPDNENPTLCHLLTDVPKLPELIGATLESTQNGGVPATAGAPSTQNATVIRKLARAQNSVVRHASAMVDVHAQTPLAHLVQFDAERDLLPLATRHSHMDPDLRCNYDFDRIEQALQERFFEGKPMLNVDPALGGASTGAFLATTASETSGSRVQSTVVQRGLARLCGASLTQEKFGRLRAVVSSELKSPETLAEARDALATAVRFAEVRLASSDSVLERGGGWEESPLKVNLPSQESAPLERGTPDLFVFLDTLQLQFPPPLVRVFDRLRSEEDKNSSTLGLRLEDCFLLLQIVSLRHSVLLRNEHDVSVFTSREELNQPMNDNAFRGRERHSFLVACALQDLLLRWTARFAGANEGVSSSENLLPKSGFPLESYLEGYELPEEALDLVADVTVNKSVSFFYHVVEKARLDVSVS